MSTSSQQLIGTDNVPWGTEPSELGKVICKLEQNYIHLEDYRPRYGPLLFPNEHDFYTKAKKEAWGFMITKLPDSESKITSDMGSIQAQARAMYPHINLPHDEFLHIILIDTCFLCHVVLFSFGGDLGYSPNDIYFGSNLARNFWRLALDSMFIVGNQLPFLVIERMMKQDFFRETMLRATNWKEPIGLMEEVIYEKLIFPVLDRSEIPLTDSRPLDLLHALYLKILGPRKEPNLGYGRGEVYLTIGSAIENRPRFPNAKELGRKGIRFRGVDGMGSRGICFERKRFRAYLYLPSLVVDESLMLVCQNLEAYEVAQQVSYREVGFFCRLMRELVVSVEDAKFLASQGVVRGEVDKLPGILMYRPMCSRDIGDSRIFHDLRLQIQEFCRPRCPNLKTSVEYVLGGALLLQTMFTVLQFFKGGHSFSGTGTSRTDDTVHTWTL